jgi:hypothetical protein
MLRRAFLLVLPAAVLRADPRQEIYDLFGEMANSLAEGNATRFLEAFDPKMPGYRDLVANVTALVEQAEVHSAIEVVEASGSAREQRVVLDWLLQLTEKQTSANAIRRQQTVKAGLVKPKRSWRILSMEPIAFFAPAKIRD